MLSSFQITCDRCPRTFSCRSSLNKHVRSAHDGIVYACLVCDKSLRSRESLVQHTRTVHALFLCAKCDALLNTEEEFADHVKLLHHTVIETIVSKNVGTVDVGQETVQETSGSEVTKNKFRTKRNKFRVICVHCGKVE